MVAGVNTCQRNLLENALDLQLVQHGRLARLHGAIASCRGAAQVATTHIPARKMTISDIEVTAVRSPQRNLG